MRFVVLCVLVVCVFARKHNGPVSLDDEKVLTEYTNKDLFDAFMALNERSYSSLAEQRHRFNIFSENLVTIRAHNVLPNSHRLGLTTFADRTEDEFEALSSKQAENTTKLVEKSQRALKFIPQTTKTNDALAGLLSSAADAYWTNTAEASNDWTDLRDKNYWDWRHVKSSPLVAVSESSTHGTYEHWTGPVRSAVSKVKNQGLFCGGCYVFAATGTLESYAWIKGGRSPTVSVPLYSEQAIIDCGGQFGGGGCSGGSPIVGWQMAASLGVFSTNAYSYQGFQWFCDSARTVGGNTQVANSWLVVQNGGWNSVVRYLRLQPVTSTMAMGGLFLYKSGVYAGKPNSVANAATNSVFYMAGEADGFGCGIKYDHVVMIVGYFMGGSFKWQEEREGHGNAVTIGYGLGRCTGTNADGYYTPLGCSTGPDWMGIPTAGDFASPVDKANYFIVKNSYGVQYGECGYSRFAMGMAKASTDNGVLIHGMCGVIQKVMLPYWVTPGLGSGASGLQMGHINNQFDVKDLKAVAFGGRSPDETSSKNTDPVFNLLTGLWSRPDVVNGNNDYAEGFGAGGNLKGADVFVQAGVAGVLTAANVVAMLNPTDTAKGLARLSEYGTPGTMGNLGFLANNVLATAEYSTFAKGLAPKYLRTAQDVLPDVGHIVNSALIAGVIAQPQYYKHFSRAQDYIYRTQANLVGVGKIQMTTDDIVNGINAAPIVMDVMSNVNDYIIPAVGHGINAGLFAALLADNQYSDYIVKVYQDVHKLETKYGVNTKMTIGDLHLGTQIVPDVVRYQKQALDYVQRGIQRYVDASWTFPPRRANHIKLGGVVLTNAQLIAGAAGDAALFDVSGLTHDVSVGNDAGSLYTSASNGVNTAIAATLSPADRNAANEAAASAEAAAKVLRATKAAALLLTQEAVLADFKSLVSPPPPSRSPPLTFTKPNAEPLGKPGK